MLADDLADEFVAEHDVAVGVVEGSAGRIADRQFGVSMKCTSDAQIAVLSVFNNNSPGPGTGSAVSRTVSTPSRRTAARMR